MGEHEEYLRRNLLVATAYGAAAGAEAALERLASTRRPPKWLIEELRGIQERAEALPADLAKWRDAADDRPRDCYAPPMHPVSIRTPADHMTPEHWLRRHIIGCLIMAPIAAVVVVGINSGWW